MTGLVLGASDSTAHIVTIGVIESVIGAIVIAVVLLLLRAARSQVEGWFKAVLSEVKPNGGKSQSNGDTTKRSEEKIDKLTLQFTKSRDNVNRRLRALERSARDTKVDNE